MTNRISLFTLLVILIAYLFSVHAYKRWNHELLGGGDPWGYYLYLPAMFIHHDLLYLDKSVQARDQYKPGYSINSPDSDSNRYKNKEKQVNKYTLGLAILFTPFFLLAHLLTQFTSYAADGYSFWYVYMMAIAPTFYTIIGFYFLRKVLLKYVNDLTTAVVMLTIALATNLYFFNIINGPMSHAYLFALYSLLIFLTIRWYEDGKISQAIGIGAVAGLITLIRPTEILCILIPLLWGITSGKDFTARLRFIGQKYGSYLAAIGVFILMGIPQLLYWKYATGHFLYYSYGEEGFDFMHAKIYHGLFGYKNGWLAYTPVMWLALAGIPFLFKRRAFLLPILIILPLHIYIIYSWWCWNYINGFGSRPMIEIYALLSIPLAYFIEFSTKKITGKVIIGLLLLFFTWMNLFNTYQFTRGVMWSEDANWAYYKAVFGKTQLDYWDLVTYDSAESQPDTNEILYIRDLYYNDFEDSIATNHTSTEVKNGRFGFMLDAATQFSPTLWKEIKELNIKKNTWIRAGAWCMRKYDGFSFGSNANIIVSFERDGKSYKWRSIRIDNKTGNDGYSLWGGRGNAWEKVSFFVKTPKNFKPNDVLKVYAWNVTQNPIYLDDLTVEMWK